MKKLFKKKFIAFALILCHEFGVGLLLMGVGFLAFNDGAIKAHTAYAVGFVIVGVVLLAGSLLAKLRE
jgi:hypothetical protein